MFEPAADPLCAFVQTPNGFVLAMSKSRSMIRILVTGGTFDKEYDELTGRLFFQETHLPEMLRRGRCRLDVQIETVMMIDSLDMDRAGRDEIVRRCRAAAESCIVITHGTDTMVETAKALAEADL